MRVQGQGRSLVLPSRAGPGSIVKQAASVTGASSGPASRGFSPRGQSRILGNGEEGRGNLESDLHSRPGHQASKSLDFKMKLEEFTKGRRVHCQKET